MSLLNAYILSWVFVLSILFQLISLTSYFDMINLLLLLYLFYNHLFYNSFSYILRFKVTTLLLLIYSFFLYVSIKMALDFDSLRCAGEIIDLTIGRIELFEILHANRTSIYDFLYQIILQHNFNDGLLSPPRIAWTYEPPSIDLLQRLYINIFNSRRLDMIAVLNTSYNLSSYMITNYTMPNFELSANNLQVLYSITWGGIMPLYLGNTYLERNHRLSWLGSNITPTFNHRVGEAFIRFYKRHPSPSILGIFLFGSYSIYHFPGLKVMIRY